MLDVSNTYIWTHSLFPTENTWIWRTEETKEIKGKDCEIRAVVSRSDLTYRPVLDFGPCQSVGISKAQLPEPTAFSRVLVIRSCFILVSEFGITGVSFLGTLRAQTPSSQNWIQSCLFCRGDTEWETSTHVVGAWLEVAATDVSWEPLLQNPQQNWKKLWPKGSAPHKKRGLWTHEDNKGENLIVYMCVNV